MNLPISNQWCEFKRKHPEGAEDIVTLSLQTISVIIVVVCAYYALKCKPFQTFSLTPVRPAAVHKISVSDKVLLRHSIHLFSKQPTLPVKISLAPTFKKNAD